MKVLLIGDDVHLMFHTAVPEGDVVLLNSIDLNGKAPAEIQLIPYGVHDTMKYGKITVDDESLNSIMAFRKKREPNDEVIDYEHATFADPPQKAPASGWIKKLINKGKEGIWAAVEWTAEARRMIENKEYRYFSPVTLTRKSDGKVLGLLGGGLTNMPNILGMVPLTNKQSFQTHKEEPQMKRIAVMLGLAETATEDEIVAALNKMMQGIGTSKLAVEIHKAAVEALGLKPEATASEITGTIMAMKQSHSQQGTLASEVTDLKNRLAAREAADVEVLVNSAIAGDAKGSKLLPAQKDWAMAYAKRDLEGFKVFLNTAAYAVVKGQVVKDPATGGSDGALDETTLQVCKAFGNNPEDVKKNMPAA